MLDVQAGRMFKIGDSQREAPMNSTLPPELSASEIDRERYRSLPRVAPKSLRHRSETKGVQV
jgi:hypothetical protein